MPLLSEEELKAFPEPGNNAVVRDYVARYWDMMALAAGNPCKVIGENALLKDKPGFEVEFLTRGSIPDTAYKLNCHEILMVMRGHWKLSWTGGEKVLAPGTPALCRQNWSTVWNRR